jgi:hypothetical protein
MRYFAVAFFFIATHFLAQQFEMLHAANSALDIGQKTTPAAHGAER